MTIADDVADARADAAEFHTDTCTATRPDPANTGTWDPSSGATAGGTITVGAGLACRVREPSSSDRSAVAGEFDWAVGDRILQLNFDAVTLRIGDTVTVTDSPQGIGLVGVPATVAWQITGSHMSAARYIVRRAS